MTETINPILSCDELEIVKDDEFMGKENEWERIDNLVSTYQKVFSDDQPITEEIKIASDKAGEELINLFFPFLYKYLTLITTGNIDWTNYEQRLFVSMFMDSREARSALYSKNPIKKHLKEEITARFNFIKETYGNYEEDYIMIDLQMLFFVLAKRYKRTNRSFCCYLYNAYYFEVFRHIQKLLRNPLNIHYRSISFDVEDNPELKQIEYDCDMDHYIMTDDHGLPTIHWIFGKDCSEEFKKLSPLERKILARYYIEHKADSDIARELGIHTNTCNNRRHNALKKICEAKGVSIAEVKRCRNIRSSK